MSVRIWQQSLIIFLCFSLISTPLFTTFATKVFAQVTSTTVTYQIASGADDVNQIDNTFTPNANPIWFGTAGSATGSYTGLRFSNIAIPRGSTIASAHFDMRSSGPQWISIGYDIYADASGNSQPFTDSNRPASRTLSTNKVAHTSDAQWVADTWYSSNDISSVIQEIINREDWQSGNNISIITKGTVGTWGRKNAVSFDGGASFAPKLIVTFADASGLPAPILSNINSSSITTTSATINWNTDLPADSQVEYGTTTAYGNTTTLDPTMVTTHSKVLSNLSSNLTYHFRVKSRGSNGILAVSSDFTFTTLYDTNASIVGQWSPVINWPLVAVHMALMPNGKVLAWDAWESGQTPSARLWDPQTQLFTSVPNNTTPMFCSAQSMLPDGRQLVIGGHNGEGVGIKNTNIFNYLTSTWTRVGDMNYARWYPSALTLQDGKVLTLGGTISNLVNASIPETFSTTTNTWTPLPQGQLDVGEYPNVYLSPNGKVFMIAGASEYGNGVSDGLSRYFDVASQTWQTLGAAPITTGTSVMYQPGKVMTSGGSGTVDQKTAVIDLSQPNPTWRTTAPMNYSRFLHSLVALPDGKVFAAGGSNIFSLSSTTGILQSEMWDPNSEIWTTMVPAQNLRLYHSTALLLPDARVLVAGGGRLSPANDYLTAEIYSPSYLFKGNRPTITNAPSVSDYGANINVDSPDAASITSASLVRLSSVTHAFNMDQRFIPLTFSVGAGSLSVQIPSDANIAPPGDYMLFILNSQGVPSVSKIIQIGGPNPSPTPTLSPTPSPTATPTPTPTPLPNPTPTPTATPIPTPTPTPAPTPVPTPTPAPTGSLTVQVNSGTDDVNEDGTSFVSNGTTDWLGTASSAASSFAGLRFNNISIPKNATITSAQLQFYSSQGQWNSISLSIAGQAIGNSPTFSSSSKPSQRTLTTTKIAHSSNINWAINTWYTLNDVTPVIQELINRSDWSAGNSLSLILKGTGSAWGRKFVKSFEAGSTLAPRLVITYN